MNFKHSFIDIQQITSEDTGNGRFYVTPEGNRYQSVTTFLGKHSDNSWLQAWKDRVGEEQANRVSTQATKRGTAVHAILEQIVLNNKFYMRGHMPNNLMMAEDIAKLLRQNIDEIYGIEIGLWSDKMQIAGRADMYASYNGVRSIVDFKTSKYLKKEEDIFNYFLQCTLYAMMVEELTGVEVPQIVIMIGVDHEGAQCFIQNKNQYVTHIFNLLGQ